MATVTDLSASLSSLSASMSRCTEMLRQMNNILDRMNGVSSASSSSSTASATSSPTTTATKPAAPLTPAAPSAASTASTTASQMTSPTPTPAGPSTAATAAVASAPTLFSATAAASAASSPDCFGASSPPRAAAAIFFRLPTPDYLTAKKKITKKVRRERRTGMAVSVVGGATQATDSAAVAGRCTVDGPHQAAFRQDPRWHGRLDGRRLLLRRLRRPPRHASRVPTGRLRPARPGRARLRRQRRRRRSPRSSSTHRLPPWLRAARHQPRGHPRLRLLWATSWGMRLNPWRLCRRPPHRRHLPRRRRPPMRGLLSQRHRRPQLQARHPPFILVPRTCSTECRATMYLTTSSLPRRAANWSGRHPLLLVTPPPLALTTLRLPSCSGRPRPWSTARSTAPRRTRCFCLAARGYDILPAPLPPPPHHSAGFVQISEMLVSSVFAHWDPGGSSLQLVLSVQWYFGAAWSSYLAKQLASGLGQQNVVQVQFVGKGVTPHSDFMETASIKEDWTIVVHSVVALMDCTGTSEADKNAIMSFCIHIPWPPDPYEIIVGITAYPIFALTDCKCTSEDDERAIQSFLIHTTLQPLFQSRSFSEILFQSIIWKGYNLEFFSQDTSLLESFSQDTLDLLGTLQICGLESWEVISTQKKGGTIENTVLLAFSDSPKYQSFIFWFNTDVSIYTIQITNGGLLETAHTPIEPSKSAIQCTLYTDIIHSLVLQDANRKIFVSEKVQKHNNSLLKIQEIFSGRGYPSFVMNNPKMVTNNWVHTKVLQLLLATIVPQLLDAVTFSEVDCHNNLVNTVQGISLQSMGGSRVDKPRNSTSVQMIQFSCAMARGLQQADYRMVPLDGCNEVIIFVAGGYQHKLNCRERICGFSVCTKATCCHAESYRWILLAELVGHSDTKRTVRLHQLTVPLNIPKDAVQMQSQPWISFSCFPAGDSCMNLLTDMEKVPWKPPWLSMQQNYAHHRLQMMHAATIIKFMGNLLCSAEKSQAPWDPGGFKSGLRASRILSGGECHGLGH